MTYEFGTEDPTRQVIARFVIDVTVDVERASDPNWQEEQKANAYAFGHAANNGAGVGVTFEILTAEETDFFGSIETEMLDRAPYLSKDLADLLQMDEDASSVEKAMATRAYHACGRARLLHTIRDLFIVGKQGLLSVRTVGQPTVDFIEHRLAMVEGTEVAKRWKSVPAPEDLIRLCRTAEEIPSILVGYNINITVGQLLATSQEELANNLYHQDENMIDFDLIYTMNATLPPPKPQNKHRTKAKLILDRAKALKVDFEAAQAAFGRN